MTSEESTPTRVLVITGTMGAGKTTVASAVGDLLEERGVRFGWIDADALCQAFPAEPGDPFRQGLLFDNLAAIAPHYRARGYDTLVIPRVVEDSGDRDRYAETFASADGPASVVIVRLMAPEAERFARLTEREPEGKWRDFALARTVELEASLERLALEDHTIENFGRDKGATALAVLEAIGW